MRHVLIVVGLSLAAVCAGQDVVKVTAPGVPWTLTIPAAGWTVRPETVSPDGKQAYFSMSNEKSGLNLSFFVEPATKCHTSRECRDMVQKAGFANLGGARDVVAAEIGSTSVVECFVPEFKGVPVKQGNLFAEFVEDGYWVDAHMSKVAYTSKDRPLFEEIVKSVSFVSKAGKP